MAKGLVAGIGEALVGAGTQYAGSSASERDRKRLEGIQDIQLGRQTQAWEERQAQVAADEAFRAKNLEDLANPDIKPFHETEKMVEDMRQRLTQPAVPPAGPAPQAPQQSPQVQEAPRPSGTFVGPMPGAQKPAPSVPNPVPGAATVTTSPRGIANVQVPGEQAAPSPTAPAGPQAPTGTAPQTISDPELASLHSQYEPFQRRAADAVAKIKREAAGDPVKERRMLAAYQRVLEADPKFKSVEEGLNSYVTRAKQEAVAARGNMLVDALVRRDPKALQGLGLPTETGTDPITGLNGVKMPDGSIFGWEAVVAYGLLKSGKIDSKSYAKTIEDMSKDRVALMKAQEQANTARFSAEEATRRAIETKQIPSTTVHISSPGDNKTIQQAEAARSSAERMAKLDKKSPEEVTRAGEEAYQKILMAPVEKTAAAAEKERNAHELRLTGAQLKEVDSSVKSATDSLTGRVKVSVDQAVKERDRLSQKFGVDAGLAYMSRLPKELNAGIGAADSVRATQPAKPVPVGGGNPLAKKGLKPVQGRESEGVYQNPKGTHFRFIDGKTEAWSNAQRKWVPFEG